MMDTTTNTPNTSTGTGIDSSLQETELGSFIYRYKVIFIALLAAAVMGVIGYGIFSFQKEKADNQMANKIFTFETSTLKNYQDKKIKGDVLVTELQSLKNELGSFEGYSAFAVKVSDELKVNNDLDSSLKILEGVTSNQSLMTVMLELRKAALYEDLNKTDMAIASLEKLINTKDKYFEGKIYLDLGRLYLTKGNSEKAKQNLEHAVKVAKEDEFRKLANLILEEMN